MQGPLAPSHAAAVLGLLLQAPPDCALVSPCGGKVEVASLLLTIHSPVLAPLLKDGGNGISLPFPIQEIRAIVSLLQGMDEEQEIQEVGEVAQLLGITLLEKKVLSSSQIKTKMGTTKIKPDNNMKIRGDAAMVSSITPQKMDSTKVIKWLTQKMESTKVELEMDPVFSSSALESTEYNNYINFDSNITYMPQPDTKKRKKGTKKDFIGNTRQSSERKLHVTNACPVSKPNVALKDTNLKTTKSQ